MDFTINQYNELLLVLITSGYEFQSFSEFLKKPEKKVIILRHDVDLLPFNSLRFAKIQSKLGVKGTYYFRAVPESWNEKAIVEIESLGHEIGYHYENLTTCNGNMALSIKDFAENLEKLRKIASVSTICMHGSPMSKYDSKDLWKKFDYRDYGIIGEPYFDIDFNKVMYLTDTGRRWDGNNVSVRDKVNTSYKQSYHSTDEIIGALNSGQLPNQIMFTFHPQRWHTNLMLWTKELILQNIKNTVKKYFFI
jgi:hypothetical protein